MELKSKSLDLVGTLREGRIGVPEELYKLDLAMEKSKGKKKQQENVDKTINGSGKKRKQSFEPRSAFLFSDGLTVVKALVKPKRSVYLLSTIHHAPRVSSLPHAKPEMILFYNNGKSGVDLLDQVVKNYSCRFTCRRWPVRIFLWLLDVAAYNAYVIHKAIKQPNVKNDTKSEYRRDFLNSLAISLMEPQIQRRFSGNATARSHLKKYKRIAFEVMRLQKNGDANAERLLGKMAVEKIPQQKPKKIPKRSYVVSATGKSGKDDRTRCQDYDCKHKFHRITNVRCFNCNRAACYEHYMLQSMAGQTDPKPWCLTCLNAPNPSKARKDKGGGKPRWNFFS